MKRFFLIFLLGGAISMSQAQKLQTTTLKMGDLKKIGWLATNYGFSSGFGSDDNNYYVNGNYNSYYIINKKLTTVKEVPIQMEKKDHHLKTVLNGDNVVVFVRRYKKSEGKGEVAMRTFNKMTGKFKDEKVIATFSMKKSDFLGTAITESPDKNKTAFLFVLADKKDKADSYYVMVMDEFLRVEWSSAYDLEISNESFSVKDFAVTNKGELYIAFFSYPENVKKAVNKKSYIDLVYLTDGAKEKMNVPLDKCELAEISLKPLKSGDMYLAALLTVDDKSYAGEFLSMKINGHSFNDGGSHKKAIDDKNTHIRFAANYLIPYNYLYYLEIEKILELDNGNIAVVCEQTLSTSYVTQDRSVVYVKVRGSVSTFFVNGNDATVEDVSIMGKTQINRANSINSPAKSWGLSIFPFAYGNKVAYLFNDEFKKYATPAKYKGTSFKNVFGKDACIVLSTQESGNKAKIEVLSGSKAAAGRLLRQTLFQEDDKLLILTTNKSGAYIETLTLP